MIENNETKTAVSIHLIAKKLAVSSPSATEMIKRLAKKELVDYAPYHGVSLTNSGEIQARFIIKSHRVWETFLVDELGYSSEEVHDEAENLEHASSPKMVEYLYAHLGYPETDPHGSKIPSELFWKKNRVEITLKQAQKEKRYYITTLSSKAKSYFQKLQVEFPHLIKVIECLEDQSMLIKEDNGKIILIPKFLEEDIYVMQRVGEVDPALKRM